MNELEKRVQQFNTLSLPGQPVSTHMGTSYLVNDLWREVQRLRDELSIKTLENLKGASVLEDMNAELARLRRIEQAAKEYIEVVDNSGYSSLDIPYSVRLRKYEAFKTALEEK